MTITRRNIIKRAAICATTGASFGGIFPPMLNPLAIPKAWANSSFELGTIKIDVLSDGNLRLPVSLLLGFVPKNDVKEFYEKFKLSSETMEPSCNLTLARDGERTILFDAGSGPDFQNSAGKILDALEAIDVEPSDITHVVFTHAHPDHLWGLLDDFDEPLFPNAHYLISKAEWDFWLDPNTVSKIGEARQVFAAGAKRRLKIIEDQITRFDFEAEILPGVRAINTAGHTPGHTAFELRSGSQSAVVVGDVLTNAYYSFQKPQWPIGSDQDRDMGIVARKNLLDQLASDQMMMIGFHIAYPGIGRVERNKSAYRFVAG